MWTVGFDSENTIEEAEWREVHSYRSFRFDIIKIKEMEKDFVNFGYPYRLSLSFEAVRSLFGKALSLVEHYPRIHRGDISHPTVFFSLHLEDIVRFVDELKRLA